MALDVGRLDRLRQEGGVYALEARTRIRVTGADRLRYLNGQLSNDLRRIKEGSAMQALVLTAKGKLCADVFVWADGDALVVDADGSLAEILPPRLERYAIADDVVFEILPEAGYFHAFGEQAAQLPGIRITRFGVEGVDVVALPETLLKAESAEVELLRIERGVPRWGRELSESTLPQEAGLEKSAVDFHKGCYVGQEVVSRIQSVGHANRILAGFVGDFDPEQASAATLHAASGNKMGHLTSAAFHPGLGKTVALGFISTRSEEADFSVLDESGACLGRAERSEFPLIS